MAFVHGSNATFSLDGTDISSYVDSVQLSKSLDTAEVTALGDSDKAYIGGLFSATMTVSGSWDATLDATVAGAMDGATCAFAYSPDGGTTTYSGNCFVTAYTPASSASDADKWSASLQASGTVSRA